MGKQKKLVFKKLKKNPGVQPTPGTAPTQISDDFLTNTIKLTQFVQEINGVGFVG